MHPQNFMIFGAYKLHNAENETMLSSFHYVNSYSPEGTTNMSTFYRHYSSFTILIFYPRDAMLARVIEIATCLSVCLSVRHAPVLCQNEES